MRRYSLVMLLLLTPVLVSGNGMVAPRSNEERGATFEARVGAVVVYKSHVGFVAEKGKVLGGNQSDGVN